MAKGKGKAVVVVAAVVAAGGAAVKAPEIARALPEIARSFAEVARWFEGLGGAPRKPTPKPPGDAFVSVAGGEAPTPELRRQWLEQEIRRLAPDARVSRSVFDEVRVDTGDADGGIELLGRWIEGRRGDGGPGGIAHPQDRRPLECSLDICFKAEEKWSISGTCRDATLGASDAGLELAFTAHGRTVSYAFTATKVRTGYGRDLPGGLGVQRTPTGYEATVCPVKTIRGARDLATFLGSR